MNTDLFMKLLLMLIGCSAAEWLYIYSARHFISRAVTRHRASDGKPSVTGGGIIFFPAVTVMLYIFGRGYIPADVIAMLCSMGALWLVSYIDDLRDIPAIPRLIVQLAAMSVALILGGGLFLANPWLLAVTVIAAVAVVNATNFIDGINGMFVGFAAVTLIPLIWVIYTYLDSPFLVAACCYLLIAVAAFAWFNVAMRDIAFAGDVGSITVGFFVAYVLALAALAGGGVSLAAIVAVYLVDVVMTICRRVMMRENLLRKHKRHLYQILAARGVSHARIARGYAAAQAVVTALYLLMPAPLRLPYFIAAIAVLAAAYIIILKKTDKKIIRK